MSSGAGFSIRQGTVSDHGGRISVESAPGRGACFTVYLPRRGPAAAAADRPAPGPGAP